MHRLLPLAALAAALAPPLLAPPMARADLPPKVLSLFNSPVILRGTPATDLAHLPPRLAPPLATTAGGPSPGLQCRGAIQAAERAAGIPTSLMAAIGRVESGRPDGNGGVNPWPWSINVEGTDHVYTTKAEAIAAVQGFQAQGIRSIDIGCMQINLLHHPDAFATLDQAFDPVANANYAARFLKILFAQTGNWQTATAWYHSATPELGTDYQRKVAAVLPDEQRRGGQPQPLWPSAGQPQALASNGPIVALPSTGAFMLSNHATDAKVLPLPAGVAGRDLAAYRAAPVLVSSLRPSLPGRETPPQRMHVPGG